MLTRPRGPRAGRFVVAFLCLATWVAPLAAQEPGVLAGRVLDAADGAPLPGVRVELVDTRYAATTERDGSFVLRGVPPGSYRLEAHRLGYASYLMAIELPPGGLVLEPIRLGRSALDVAGVVVAAAGGVRPRREIGSAIALIRPSEADLSATTTLHETLASRVPGLLVRFSGGTTGAGERIRIRGANSPFLPNEPLVILDGVRIPAQGPQYASTALNGQLPSRLNDLSAEELESIEVLRGPAAAALYGTAAANGVIQLRTRIGAAGGTRWRLVAEGGELRDTAPWPANVRGYGPGPDGNWGICPLTGPGPSQARGDCTLESLERLNVMRDPRTTPLRTGARFRLALSAEGGGEGATFFFHGEQDDERGVYASSRSARQRFRSNLAADLGPHLEGRVTLGYARGETTLPHNDNSGLGLILNALLGATAFEEGQDPSSAYWNGLGPAVVNRYAVTSGTDRWTTGASLEWRPAPRLVATLGAGMDQLLQHDHRLLEAGTHLWIFGSPFGEGFRASSRLHTRHLNLDGALALRTEPRPSMRSTTTLGASLHRIDERRTAAFGAGLLGGTGSLEGTTEQFSVSELNRGQAGAGLLLRQELAWRDRLFIAGSIRADRDQMVGADAGATLYPALSLAWAMDRASTPPPLPGFSSLRLRAAMGESGLHPAFRQARSTFEAGSVRIMGEELPAIVPSTTGNRDLRPERVREVEGGLDAGLLDERFALELTIYRKVSRNALVSRPIPPSMGLTETRWENLGSVSNRGAEILARFDLVRTPGWSLHFTGGGAWNRNRIDRLGSGVEAVVFGLNGDTQRHAEGHSLGAYFQPVIQGWRDASGSGIVEVGEVRISTDEAGAPRPLFIGHSLPVYQATLAPELRIGTVLTLAARFDHQGGHHLLNGTRLERCASGTFRHRCSENFDPAAPIADQVASVAVEQAGTLAGYIEPADFWKLRELSLGLELPNGWLAPLGERARGASLHLSARNLRTWTDYSGVDPEVNNTGTVNHNSADFGTQPAPRVLLARLVLRFR